MNAEAVAELRLSSRDNEIPGRSSGWWVSCFDSWRNSEFFFACVALLPFQSIIVAKTMYEVRCYTRRVRCKVERNVVKRSVGFINGGAVVVSQGMVVWGGPVDKGRTANSGVWES